MNTDLPFAEAGIMNVLRYQPMPPGNAPPPGVAGFFSLNSPSMLQSCGRFRALHLESLKSGASPLVTSPRLNRQSSPKFIVFPGRAFANTRELQGDSNVTARRQIVINLSIPMAFPSVEMVTFSRNVIRARSQCRNYFVRASPKAFTTSASGVAWPFCLLTTAKPPA